MFQNVGDKIKGLAVILVFISIFGGAMWLVYSIRQYIEYKDFLDYYSDSFSEYYQKALAGRNGLLFSIILIVGGTISSIIMYGFGELIERVASIDDYFKDKEMDEKVLIHKTEHTKAVNELYEQQNDSSYNG